MINSPIRIKEKLIENRVVLQPMEGCDCSYDGAPSELTVEKYLKARLLFWGQSPLSTYAMVALSRR